MEYKLNKRCIFNIYLDEVSRSEHIFIRELKNCNEFEVIYYIDHFYNEVQIEFFILNLSLIYPINLNIKEAKENFRHRDCGVVHKGQILN